ncbi:MAG: prolipoprotein diacylglyceryl transferase [Myxococcota bacterium]
MYPTLFTIPGIDYPISTFGVMLAIAFLAGFWITAKRMQEESLDPEFASTLLIYAMAGGLIGSKLYYAIDVGLRTGTPFFDLFFARAGITWYGGLIGGLLACYLGTRIHKADFLTLANCSASSLAVGQSLGRIGCFLVGDDYGKATDLPWAVAFPQGAPPTPPGIEVHPTQLYEVMWLLPVAGLLWLRRKKSPFVFGEYLVANGAGRIVIEHWRVNPEVALGLTEPQWIGIALIVAGVGGWLYYLRRQRAREATA